MGYRIYRMADSLQATAPVFMRLDFGSANAGTLIPNIWPTIGTGSNGSGTITGTMWDGGATLGIGGQNSATTAYGNCYGSAGTARFALAMWIQVGNTQIPVVFTLERTKDASGNDTNAGLLLVYRISAAGSVAANRFLVFTGTQPSAEPGLSFVLSGINPSETFGGDIGVGILIHFKGVAQQPGTNIMFVNSSDVSSLGTVNLTLYGATRTYQHLGASTIVAKMVGGAGQTDNVARLMVRYD
jgi:hypothetical protein